MTSTETAPRSWVLPDMTGTRLTANDRPHWSTRAKTTAEWRALAAVHARHQHIPPLTRARVLVQWLPPTAARHDPANAYPMVKAVVDGLVDAGLLPDDSDEFLVGPVMLLGPVVPVGRHLRGCATLRVTVVEVAAQPSGTAPSGGHRP